MENNRLMEMFSSERPEEEMKASDKKIKRAGRPSVYNSADSPKKMQGIQMTEEEIAFCKLRAKEEKELHQDMTATIAGYLRYLLKTDIEAHPDIMKKARKIVALENS